MIKTIILTITLTLNISFCFSQTEDEKTEKEAKKALKEWFENPTISDDLLDPNAIDQFEDSGRFENGVKEGLWIEYALDSSMMGETVTIKVGDKDVPMTFGGVLQKEIGEYSNGKKEGIWTTYESRDKEPPFYWNRRIVTNFKNGKKHGEEINYHGYEEKYQRPIQIKHWKNGIEHGIGKIYDVNHPYKLQQVYNAIDGQMWLLEQYYPNGKLQAKFTDTTIAGQELKYLRTYYESGALRETGYYINGKDKFGKWKFYYENGKVESIENYENDKLNGNYKYYHDNGQLWTEREYKNGLLWNVYSNYNRNGKKNDEGTIKNGTGTLNIYDAEGKLTDTVEYVNGEEK
ncbi:toxin-antitoxin system YwqK family antitoxin [Marivirga tractuosa]|uniref:toxin-antitoxin system YwqK family antitoxin n=1 Tax=Marivirga tractuosa TaxID=1006 RepID=UPI0035D1105D